MSSCRFCNNKIIISEDWDGQTEILNCISTIAILPNVYSRRRFLWRINYRKRLLREYVKIVKRAILMTKILIGMSYIPLQYRHNQQGTERAPQ